MVSISVATFSKAKIVPRPAFRYISFEMGKTDYNLLIDQSELLRVLYKDGDRTYAIKCPRKMMVAALLAAEARGVIS